MNLNILRARMLDYASLKPTVKSALWLSFGVIVVTALLTAIRDQIGGQIIQTGPGVTITLGRLIVTSILAMLAFTVFLTGFFAARTKLPLFIFALFGLVYIFAFAMPLTQEYGLLWGTVAATVLAGVPFAYLSVLAITGPGFRLLALAGSVAAALSLFAMGFVVVGTGIAKGFSPDVAFVSFGALGLCAIPMFFLAAADFAELGEAYSERLARIVREHWPYWVSPALAVALCLVNIAIFISDTTTIWNQLYIVGLYFGIGVVPFVAVLLLFFLLRGKGVSGGHLHLPIILAASVGLMLWHASAYDSVRELQPSPAYSHDGTPRFSIIMPEGWYLANVAEDSYAAFSAYFRPTEKAAPEIFLYSLERNKTPRIEKLSQLLPGGFPDIPMPELEDPDADGWQRFEVSFDTSFATLSVYGFKQEVPNSAASLTNRDWYILMITKPEWAANDLPKLEAVKDSFSFSRRTQKSQPARYAASGGMALCAILCFLLIWRFRFSSQANVLLGFVAVIAAMSATQGAIAPLRFVILTDLRWDNESLLAIAFFTGLMSLVFGGYIFFTNRSALPLTAELVTTLNLSVIVIFAIFLAFRELSDLGEDYVIAKALIALLTISWEIVFAGQAFTNQESARYPRHTRVLMHLGYVQFVAMAIFFFFPINDKTFQMKGFDPEMYVATGVVNIGIPLVLTLFVLRCLREFPNKSAA